MQQRTHRPLTILTIALTLALSAGCGSVTDPDSADPDAQASPDVDAGDTPDGGQDAAPMCNAPTPGTFNRQVMVDGVERDVIVYIPANVQAQAPAVFMFHGSSGTGERFYNISRWREKADEIGLIAVFPTALVHCFYDTKDERIKTSTKWSGGKFGSEHLLCTPEQLANISPANRALADHPEADDIGFVNAMIDMLISDDCVDANRVYLAGFSNGGSMSGRAGLELSHRIAAFAMSSGAPAVDTVASRPISAMYNHGALESGLPLDETAWNNPAYQGLLAGTAEKLGLTSDHNHEPMVIAGVATSWLNFTTTTGVGGNSYHAVIIDGLAHNYANGSNHPITMANVHWAFFEMHTLDEHQ